MVSLEDVLKIVLNVKVVFENVQIAKVSLLKSFLKMHSLKKIESKK